MSRTNQKWVEMSEDYFDYDLQGKLRVHDGSNKFLMDTIPTASAPMTKKPDFRWFKSIMEK